MSSLGMLQELGPVLSTYNDDNLSRLMNITEFADRNTNFNNFRIFMLNIVRMQIGWIALCSPERNDIENLSQFPLPTDIKIFSEYFDNVMNLIKIIGR